MRLPLGERLRAELGSPRRARRVRSSPRSRVWRVELPGGPAVVKQLVGGPAADDGYAREVAALTLASRADPPVAPALLGTDSDENVLVLEYLEHQRPHDEWAVDYATALARLHACARSAGAGVLPAWSGPTHDDVDSFLRLAGALGVAVPAGVRTELGDVVHRLSRPPAGALLHGDPCPGNDLHTRAGVRFIDFEQAALGDGLVELAYLRIGFPTCWCVTAPPQPILDAAETAYRAAWRDATGLDASIDLTDACVGWLLRGDALVDRARRGTADQLARIPNRDWRWGTATARGRLAHRLGVVSQLTADRGDLPGTIHLAAAMRENMSARWPTLHPPPVRRP